MKKFVWTLLALAVVGAIALVAFRKEDEPLQVTVEKATRGDITSLVTATGKVFPEVEVSISSEVAGEIVELPVSDGQTVSKGQLLVRVNPITLEAQVLQQEAALRANQANSAEAKARMLQAELNLRRSVALREKGFASEDELLTAETQHEISKASYSATLSRIEQQEMSLKEARDTLAKATTYSPVDGTVTVLKAELGDRVVGTGQFEGTEIMRVANLKRIETRVDVSEADIVSVKVGDHADIEIDSLPDQTFAGVVSEIANSATATTGTQQELTTFLVKVSFLDPSEAIRPGMTATTEIKTKTVAGVVKAPIQAVTVRERDVVAEQLGEPKADRAPASSTESGRRSRDTLERVVFILADGKAVLRRVQTGIADRRSIEIVAGVAEGETVLTGGYRALTREVAHNLPVKVEQDRRGAADAN